MSTRIWFTASICLLCTLFSPGCQHYSEADTDLLAKYHGRFVLSGEGPGRYRAPVELVAFDDENHALVDDDFAAVFPALRQLDPTTLLLRGSHRLTDRSIPLLNKLRAVYYLDVSGTELTFDGLRSLRLKHLRNLFIAPERFSAEQAAELQRELRLKSVTR